jgi:acetolactate synthase-1/2/3 large subunit
MLALGAMPEFVPGFAQTSGGEGPHGGLLMARALRDAGVDTIFALCGGHILGLLDGCLDVGIRVIDTRHEGAASLAAEGWALATGRTGVAAVTAGPGFSNALTGFVDAGVWSVPMLLIAGRTGLHQRGRGAVMDVDQRSMVAPVAKWAETCYRTELIPRYVGEALGRARAGTPGPAYLEVPQDVFMARAGAAAEATAGVPDPPPAPAPDGADLERALDVLQEAEAPVILVGSGGFWSGAGEEIARLAERAEIPVITTSAARGVVGDSHPWCLGSLVHAGAALAGADAVLVLGSAFNANVMYGGPPLFALGQTIIQVDISPERIGGNRLPDVAIVGDVRRVVAELADAWRKTPPGRADWRTRAYHLTRMAAATWDAQIEGHRGPRIHAGAMAREICSAVGDLFGGKVTVVADGGDVLTWMLAYARAELPGRLLSTTTALGTLGVGLPFALAAQAARPDEPVVCVMGDGSFGLTAMEIDTCVRHRVPVVCVVSNNYGWRDVSHEQDAWYGAGRRVASELADARYDRLAEALGGHGERVRSLDQLRPALIRALERGVASVIDVETDPEVLSDLLRNLGPLGLM